MPYPSVSTLASRAGVDKRTIRRTTERLVKKGLLGKHKQLRYDGSQSSSAYDVRPLFKAIEEYYWLESTESERLSG